MSTKAKQDMHWRKETAFYFIIFYLIIVFRDGSQARLELLSNLLAFQCDVGCIPLSACLWHAKKDMIYA